MISVIVPSRGRPESLFRAVSSFAKEGVEVVVGLDDDDPTAFEAMKLLSDLPVRIVKAPRHESLPALQNALAATAKGDFILPMSDDYTIEQDNWPELVMKAASLLPNGLGIVFLNDPMYPGFCTFPVIPRKLMELQGFLMAPWFPFLFTDTWWNEVGTLCGCKWPSEASVKIQHETGHDHKYLDLADWAELFELTRPQRIELARKIVDGMGLDPTLRAKVELAEPVAIRHCERFQAEWKRPEFIARLEKMGAYEPTEGYRALKQRAEDLLPGLRAEAEAARAALPKPPYVVFGVPSAYHSPKLGFSQSILSANALLARNGVEQVWLYNGGDLYLSKVRNNLVSKALRDHPEMTHFFFLDDDLTFPAEAVLDLIRSPFDVVAGIYPKKSDTLQFPCELAIDPETKRPFEKGGFVRAHAVPTGFLCIKADVLRKQAAASPTYRDLDNTVCHNIFEMGFCKEPQPDGTDGQWWGEDYAWCRRYREEGGELWVKPDIEFGHTGTKTWRGNFMDSVRLPMTGVAALDADGKLAWFPAGEKLPDGWTAEGTDTIQPTALAAD